MCRAESSFSFLWGWVFLNDAESGTDTMWSIPLSASLYVSVDAGPCTVYLTGPTVWNSRDGTSWHLSDGLPISQTHPSFQLNLGPAGDPVGPGFCMGGLGTPLIGSPGDAPWGARFMMPCTHRSSSVFLVECLFRWSCVLRNRNVGQK